jgi:hypothetical protein
LDACSPFLYLELNALARRLASFEVVLGRVHGAHRMLPA